MAFNLILKIFIIPLLPVAGILLNSGNDSSSEKGSPPQVVYKLGKTEGSLTKLPGGKLMLFKTEGADLYSMVSDDGSTWSTPRIEIRNHFGLGGGLMLADRDGELHNVTLVRRDATPQTGGLKGPGATIMIDVWHTKTNGGRIAWEKPKMIFEGYCGAVIDFKQLRSGRLIVPYAWWVAGQLPLPRGLNISTVLYSDDEGNSWNQSLAQLTAPTYKEYPGNNYGAIEPSIAELEHNGHLWMLMRTQTGFLYETFSADNGTNWTPPSASRFYSYNGPPLLTRLPDNRLFLVWNNSDAPPRFEGQDVYGGRDAIHAAISDDFGKTWRGFREIHRDPLRNETPPKTGDRGTAYANSPVWYGGKILLITGMGENRRHIVSIDPDWLTARHHESDFSKGLDEWTVFKHFGPASRSWRDRVAGPRLISHPSSKGMQVLHIRRPDEKDPDGAVWNFPNGLSGKLALRIMLNKGFRGGTISLTDRFFNPSDDHGDRLAMFCLPIAREGQKATGLTISAGQWHLIELLWNIKDKTCVVKVDGKQGTALKQANETLNGISYLRLRSTADEIDTAGFFVESVVADIDDEVALQAGQKEKKESEARYRASHFSNEK